MPGVRPIYRLAIPVDCRVGIAEPIALNGSWKWGGLIDALTF